MSQNLPVFYAYGRKLVKCNNLMWTGAPCVLENDCQKRRGKDESADPSLDFPEQARFDRAFDEFKEVFYVGILLGVVTLLG